MHDTQSNSEVYRDFQRASRYQFDEERRFAPRRSLNANARLPAVSSTVCITRVYLACLSNRRPRKQLNKAPMTGPRQWPMIGEPALLRQGTAAESPRHTSVSAGH